MSRSVSSGGVWRAGACAGGAAPARAAGRAAAAAFAGALRRAAAVAGPATAPRPVRSEEHTSELQSRVDLVCRLLLEKKKKKKRKECTRTKIHNSTHTNP